MATHDYLFTYTVSPLVNGTEADAQKVRRAIRDIKKNGWEKLDKLETTFAGEIDIPAYSTDGKRSDAKKQVTIVLKAARDSVDVNGSQVDIHVALLVDKLGSYIGFTI